MADDPSQDFAHSLAYLAAAVAASVCLWLVVLTAAGCVPIL